MTLGVERNGSDPVELTPVYRKVRGLLDEWFKYAEDWQADQVDVTYTSDGSSEQETRRIYLERSGDGYLITDDEIATG